MTSYKRLAGCLAGAAALAMLVGCGGADLFSNSSRPGSLDSGLSGGFGNSFGNTGGSRVGQTAPPMRGRGAYPKVEASFELGEVKGNPFDFVENDVQVSLTTPDNHTIKLPAFYDGGKVWRVRYTPDAPGRHQITQVTLNGHAVQPDKFDKREFDVNGSPTPGFIRRDTREKLRFAFDNGNTYFPVGHNLAFAETSAGHTASLLEKMGKAGENWSRIWMTAIDGKALEYPSAKEKLPLGALNLEAAKKWDEIVDSAEKAGVHFQMVLHHHGQYSTRTDAAWAENPLNAKNGGLLSTPDEFFSNPRAVALEKARARYIIARWGYSPSIMAWELFNEVENTDSIEHQHADEVASWHSGLAGFIRQQDPFKHLITTSSSLQLASLWQAMDYAQPHAYVTDPLGVAQLEWRKMDRPVFYGELGMAATPEKQDSEWMHRALWAGVVSSPSGAPGLWGWESIDKQDLYGELKGAAEFVRQSGLSTHGGLLPATATVETKERGPLVFSPGAGWASSKQTEFTVSPSGVVSNLASMPSYLQGSAHREMFSTATFKVNYPEAGTFKVALGKVARGGAKVVLTLDGGPSAEKEFAVAKEDHAADASLEVKVPAGDHLVKLENTGLDWATVSSVTLDPYAPALTAVGRSNKDYAVLWLVNRSGKETTGKVSIPGLQSASYHATWWDAHNGKALNDDTVSVSGSQPLSLTTPAVAGDVALYVVRSGDKVASKPPKGGKKAKGE